jgi:hypothetical protein
MDDKTLLKAYKLEINSLKARLAAMEGSHIQGLGQMPSPFLQITNGMKESKRTGSNDANDGATDDNEIESEGLILQVWCMTGGKLSSLLQAALTALHFNFLFS